jgi:hypothetical protein
MATRRDALPCLGAQPRNRAVLRWGGAKLMNFAPRAECYLLSKTGKLKILLVSSGAAVAVGPPRQPRPAVRPTVSTRLLQEAVNQ